MSELELVFVSRKRYGKYVSTLEWYVKDDVWIDNCFKSTVTNLAGNIIEIIDKIRPIPDKIRPDHIVPPPIEGNPPFEGTSKLWYFDPKYLTEDYIFMPPLKESVTAWAIKINDDVFIFDARTGRKIGRNRIPASNSITFSYYAEGFPPGCWDYARDNATGWFKNLGFSNTVIYGSSDAEGVIRNSNTKYWYCVAHGSPEGIEGVAQSWKIANWMRDRPPMWFAFLNQCNAMSKTGSGTLSHAFRRGQMKDTVTIGLRISIAPVKDWETKLFSRVRDGDTWGDAFDQANATYQQYDYIYGFCGDRNMKIVGSNEIPKGIMKFDFSEVKENHLPEYVIGYVCGVDCRSHRYSPPSGYKETICEVCMKGKGVPLLGGHNCPSNSTLIRCDKSGYVPTEPKGSYIECTSSPSGASIWLKKY